MNMSQFFSILGAGVGGIVVGWVLRSAYGARQTVTRAISSSADKSGAAGAVKAKVNSKEPMKMMLCVRSDLKMGKGKIAAQCAHAAVGACERLMKNNPDLFKAYTYQGQPKIAVSIPDEEAMDELAAAAKAKGVSSYIVHDAGKTQLAPNTATVLAVGPGPASVVDSITRHLKLL